MFQKTFSKSFEKDLFVSIYKKMRDLDQNVFVLWRNSFGVSVSDEDDAAGGEIRNSDGKKFFVMNSRETVVDLDKAGALKSSLVQAMKEFGVVDESVDYSPGVIGLVVYVVLCVGGGFYFAMENESWAMFLFIVSGVSVTVFGVFMMNFACREGGRMVSFLAILILFFGMLATLPASLLVKPVVRFLRRGQLLKAVKECE